MDHFPRSRAVRAASRCLATILTLAALAFPRPAASEDVFNSSFPRLYYNDAGSLDGNVQHMSRYDVLKTDFSNAEGPWAAKLDSLSLLNPDMQLMAYINSCGHAFPDIGDPNHVVNRLIAGIQNAWFVRNEFGQYVIWDPTIPDMEMLNLSSKCPRVNGKTWGEYIADFAIDEILSEGSWDGIFWDNLWDTASWVNAYIPGSLDFNLDGVPDHPDSADAWWQRGVNQMLARLQSRLHFTRPMMGNGNGRWFDYLNGRNFEDFPFRESWPGSMQSASQWQLYGVQPSLLTMVTRGSETNFRLMRYGVCSALIAGTFSHHQATEHSSPNPIFYDEYGVDLGKPISPPIELGVTPVATAGFETGIPASFSTACGSGEGVWTQDPNLVIDGVGSLLGRPGGPYTWQLFLCTDPDLIELNPGATYTIIFNYRVVVEPPGDGYFFVNARSDVDIGGSDRNAIILDVPAGSLGQARGEVTLGNYQGYYILWGLRLGGQIVIDSIQILSGQGGFFRRNFDHGIGLVNPTGVPRNVPLGGTYHRIDGVIDPFTNNGENVTQVALGAYDGLVLLNGPAPTGIPESDSPRIEPLYFAFPNPVNLSMNPAVQIAGVPPGGSVAIVSPLGRIVRILTERHPDGGWRWDLKGSARPAAAGVYLAVIRDPQERAVGTLRMILTR